MLDTKQDIGANLFDVFQPYKIPLNLSQDYLDPVDGLVHRSQERCLGISTIQIGSQVYPNCTFFEMTESEISEVCSSSSSPHQEEESVPESPTSSLDGLASFALSNGVPPKKRKRRRTVRYDVIFTMDKKVSTLSNEHTFYAFPREAVTECLTTTAPHKLIFSCFPNTINKSLNCGCDATPVMEQGSFKTKLEEFAAVCSNRCKLTLPDQSAKIEGFGMSIIISKASNELYLSMKQLVSAYETMCQNAMNLIKSHNHEITKHKWTMLLPERPVPNQSENLPNKHEEAWAKDTTMEETCLEVESEQLQQYKLSPPPQKSIKKLSSKAKSNSAARPSVPTAISAANLGKKCLYCGSKSTPMWRRGPQGAGTLCNACGVKWKHGKILIGNGTDAAIPAAVVSQDSKPKSEKKRKRLITTTTTTTTTPGNQKRSSNKKKHHADGYYRDEFAMPAPKEVSNQQAPWEGQSTTSSSTDSCSPLESFSSSPNTSPSLLLSEQKRDMSSLLSYDKESLSVYVGEDAVEAAALLTLLKRS